MLLLILQMELAITKPDFLWPAVIPVKFEHPDYGSKEVVVNLSAGEVTIQDFVFQANFVSGIVQDEQGKPIDNVHVLLQNTAAESVISARTDASGKFKIPASLTNNYQILAAAWGYKGKAQTLQSFDDVVVVLESGYEDDFFADLDWKITKTVRQETGNELNQLAPFTTMKSAIPTKMLKMTWEILLLCNRQWWC